MRPPGALLAFAVAGAALALAGCTSADPAPGPAAPRLDVLREGLLPSPDGLAWEPSAAINPRDGRNAIVAVSDGNPGLAVHATADAGATWTRTVLPVGAEAEAGTPEAEWTFMGDPVAFFAPDGTAYVGGLGRTVVGQGALASAEGADIFVAASSDGGRTFGPALVVARGQGTVASLSPAGEVLSVSTDLHNLDKPWFAAGPSGRILAAWNDLGDDYHVSGPAGLGLPYEGNEMEASWSDDGGATWTSPSVVEPVSPRSPVPFFGPGGAMRIAHSRWSDGLLRVAAWTDGQWSAVELGEVSSQPVVATLPDGTAWMAAALADGTPALWRDGGAAGWQGPSPIGPAAATDPRANVALAGGHVWASWYGEVDGRSHHVRVQLADGAVLERVLARGLDGADAAYGHYSNGLAAGPDGALVAWPERGPEPAFRFAWLAVGP